MVYVITAVVGRLLHVAQLASARERPAVVRRTLYDDLNGMGGKAEQRLASNGKAQHNVVALEEMTESEKLYGHISRAPDADPALNTIRESVAREALALGATYREGSGAGARYTAFERHTKLMRHSLAELQGAERTVAAWRAETRPDQPSELQLRRFHAMYDTLPWASMDQLLGRSAASARGAPALPAMWM
jgi:hypothetical protein